MYTNVSQITQVPTCYSTHSFLVTKTFSYCFINNASRNPSLFRRSSLLLHCFSSYRRTCFPRIYYYANLSFSFVFFFSPKIPVTTSLQRSIHVLIIYVLYKIFRIWLLGLFEKKERLEKWKYTQIYEPLLIICRGGILTVSNQ